MRRASNTRALAGLCDSLVCGPFAAWAELGGAQTSFRSSPSRCASTDRPRSGRLDSPDGRDSVDTAGERGDRLDCARLCAGDEIGVGEVDPVDLVDLERTKEQRRIDNDDRREADHGPDELCDSLSLHLVERLEYEDHLGDDKVGHEQLIGGREERGRPARLNGRVAGQMSDEDVRVEEDAQARVFARAARVRRRTSCHWLPRFCAGKATAPARSRTLAVRASMARRPWTRNTT